MLETGRASARQALRTEPALDACPRDVLLAELRGVLSRHSGVPAEQIALDTPIDDRPGGLGLDSLDRIEVGIIVGRRAHISIPDEHVDAPELGTLGGLARYVDARNRGLTLTLGEGGHLIFPPESTPLPLEGQ